MAKMRFRELGLALGCLFLCVQNLQAQEERKPPNVILFITDDIGWNDLGAYGNSFVKTPNVDRLAKMGAKFNNFYLTTSSCSPSRNSIITGRFPHNTGAPELHDALLQGQVMFPGILKEAGYYTALSGKNHMGPDVKAAFDTISRGKGPGGEEDWIPLLQNRPEGKPFFFWFASHDAHRNWQIDGNAPIYDPDSIQVPPMLFDGPETRQDLAQYYHEVSRADYFLGQLVEELEQQEILENTYIIFMSDNGRPFPRNKARLYDSGIKSFFIVAGPEVARGENSALLSAIDIAPTILELAGVGTDKRIQGKSFRKIIVGSQKSIRDFAFAEHNWHVFQAHERMVRFGDWLYIKNGFPDIRNLSGESTRMFPAGDELWDAYEVGLTTPAQEDVFLVPRPGEELYNIKKDPYQFENLADTKEHQHIKEYLGRVLEEWVSETGDSKPSAPSLNRDDNYGERLPGEWKRGERPGEKHRAWAINNPGPVLQADLAPNINLK